VCLSFWGEDQQRRGGAEGMASCEERGQKTALTRRGLLVEGLSCDFARNSHRRQSPMRAAYNRREEPLSSGLRSCG
jgi:hypothetical protein